MNRFKTLTSEITFYQSAFRGNVNKKIYLKNDSLWG